MKITLREILLIGIAVVLLGVTLFIKMGFKIDLPVFWPDRSTSFARLDKARQLLRDEKLLKAKATETAEIERAMLLSADPQKWRISAISSLTALTTSLAVNPVELKPGILQVENGITILPVQLKLRTSLETIMEFLTELKHQLPMSRVKRLNISPAAEGNVEALALVEFVLPGQKNREVKKTVRGKLSSGYTVKSRSFYLDLLKQRINTIPAEIPDWTRLSLALWLGDSKTGDFESGTNGFANQPQLLGVVTIGSKTQALIGIGSDSWYLAPGEQRGNLRLVSLGRQEATVYYQGRSMRLTLPEDFTVSPLN